VKVTSLRVHPIKACHGFEVERVAIGDLGIVGDREWQLMDAETRAFITQRTHPELALVHPEPVDDGVLLHAEGRPDLHVRRPASLDTTTTTFTGEVAVGDGGDDAAAWFSELLGASVRLVGMAPGYERPVPGLFEGQVGLGDAAPIVVVNEASHRFLVERAKEPFGLDRWRTGVVVDAGEPWVEDTWQRIRVGPVTMRFVIPWPRCAVPQVDQDTGARHKEPAVVLKAHRWCRELPHGNPLEQLMLPGNALFGMAADIETRGVDIAVGDDVEVLAAGEALLRI
jgi:uncharacterized protein YcbX